MAEAPTAAYLSRKMSVIGVSAPVPGPKLTALVCCFVIYYIYKEI